MPLLVVGSVALDCVETPTDRRDDVLGGSAVFFSYAASFFSPVKMIGTVGEDWPREHTAFLEKRGIDTSGIEVIPGGKTFRWRGRYLPNMNDRETLEVHLNVFGEFKPKLHESHRRSKFLFLGNASPVTQLSVLDQVPEATLTVADTMDLWINIQRDELEALLGRIDGLVLNDSEAKLLAEDENLVRAGHAVRAMGPKFVVIKKGEHGAMFFSEHEMYVLPAYPTPRVLDQVPDAKLTVADTMDLWINIQRDELEALLKRIDGLVLNDSEAKLLAEDENLVRAGHKVRAMGPKFVVIKKGEHGAMFFSEHEMYVLPAYPTPQVLDPTGAGDSFAGGMMGYLANKDRYDPQSMKEALAYGVVTASYTVEDFSLDRLAGIDRADLDRRVAEYRQMLTF